MPIIEKKGAQDYCRPYKISAAKLERVILAADWSNSHTPSSENGMLCFKPHRTGTVRQFSEHVILVSSIVCFPFLAAARLREASHEVQFLVDGSMSSHLGWRRVSHLVLNPCKATQETVEAPESKSANTRAATVKTLFRCHFSDGSLSRSLLAPVFFVTRSFHVLRESC